MIKVLPIENKVTKCKPRFVLCVTLGYGEHCDDTYTYKNLQIVDSKKGLLDTWNYITTKEAEKLFKFFRDILNREECDHITLNDAWELGCKENPTTFWYEDYMSEKEIKQFAKFYEKYNTTLFNPEVEHNWYGIVGVAIYYFDENGDRHNCEV